MTHRNKGWLIVAESIGLTALNIWLGADMPVFYVLALVTGCSGALVAAVNLGLVDP